MSLINFVMVAPNGDGRSVHVQVTGCQFPQGYTSGEIDGLDGDEVTKEMCYVPSMRGSGRLYLPLVRRGNEFFTPAGEFICDVEELVDALGAPSPAYYADDAPYVAQRVQNALDVAAKGAPKAAAKGPNPEQVEAAIRDALEAALRQLWLK